MNFADRLARARAATAAAGLDALLIGSGADLRYLTGYPGHGAERITCLVLPAAGDPVLVVPKLERPAALASPLGGLGLEVLDWAARTRTRWWPSSCRARPGGSRSTTTCTR